jgi:hypothetical protein
MKAAKRISLNSKIDIQRSLWRFYENAELKRETAEAYGRLKTIGEENI